MRDSTTAWFFLILHLKLIFVLFLGHRLVRLCIDDLVREAIEAHKFGETEEQIIITEHQVNFNECFVNNVFCAL